MRTPCIVARLQLTHDSCCRIVSFRVCRIVSTLLSVLERLPHSVTGPFKKWYLSKVSTNVQLYINNDRGNWKLLYCKTSFTYKLYRLTFQISLFGQGNFLLGLEIWYLPFLRKKYFIFLLVVRFQELCLMYHGEYH